MNLSVIDQSAQLDLAAAQAGRPAKDAEIPGAAWIPRDMDFARAYSAVASSQDGRRILALVSINNLRVSTNYGANWSSLLITPTAGPGALMAWGDSNSGQTATPAGLSNVTAIAAGGSHSVALKGDGSVVAWGAGKTSTGSDPEHGQSIVPTDLGVVTAIAAGFAHTVALKSDGTVRAWGYNNSGQIDVPAGLRGVTSIAAGNNGTVALKGDGTVVAWGLLGQASVPADLTNVTAIAAGERVIGWLGLNGTLAKVEELSHAALRSPAPWCLHATIALRV